MQESRRDAFPFIVGVGRSGTTLLRSMLDAHGDLAVVHESRFVGWMAQNRRRYERDGAFSADRFLADLLDERSGIPSRLAVWGVPPRTIRAAVVDTAPVDLAAAVRALYATYAAHRGKPRYADKTPGYLSCMPALGRLFPEARFVHLVRDGRNVALSMLDVDFGGVNVAHAAWLWSRRVRAAQVAGADLGPARYLVVRYEDLIDEPARVLAPICDFLGLRFDPQMLRYLEQPDRVVEGLGQQRHHRLLRRPMTIGPRDWRSQMHPAAVRRFESVAGDTLVDFGYALNDPTAGRPNELTWPLIAHGAGVAAWRARRRARRAP